MPTESLSVYTTTFSNNYWWLIEIIVGLLALFIVNLVFKRIVKLLRHRALSTPQSWCGKIGEITFLPVSILLWVLGFLLVIEVLSSRFGFLFFDEYLDAFRVSMVVGALSWLLLRWKMEVQLSILHRNLFSKKVDMSFVHVIGRILSVVIVFIAGMIIMQVWGVNLAPLIAFGGIGAAAIGFSAKDVIGNFFGGLMLYITRPFMVGDWVILTERNLEGTVEEIGWYLTSIRDKDKRPVYLPNAIFSNALVVNASRMTHRRILEKIGVRYDDFSKINLLCEELKEKLMKHPSIDAHLPVLVVFNAFNAYSLDILVDVYTLVTRYDHYLAVKHEILTLVYENIQAKGARIPLPVMDLMHSS